jgi:hypothetical protein
MEAIQYDLEYFIAKFEAISEDKWTASGVYVDDFGCKCALGHCGVIEYISESDEARALSSLAKGLIVSVNDNNYKRYSYLGSTPKQRVINYLKSLK